MSVLPKFLPASDDERRQKTQRALLRKEAEIGGRLFGPIPKNRRRQFFCLDEHTWVWHEEWLDQRKQRRAITTRYEVRPNGVLKLQDGHIYQRLSRQEARNLYRSVELYRQKVGDYYRQLLQTA
jgi:hypothetical protein